MSGNSSRGPLRAVESRAEQVEPIVAEKAGLSSGGSNMSPVAYPNLCYFEKY